MEVRENTRETRLLTIVFLALGLFLAACTPSPLPTQTGEPVPTASPSPAPVGRTARPTAAPTPLPPPQWSSSYPPVLWPYYSGSPAPTSAIEGELATALDEFHRVRAEAEETLNPDLLSQVCVDPYLSQKAERIRANARDGTHWETVSTDVTITWLDSAGYDEAHLGARKVETKLFFGRGSAVPDDEVCSGAIYSYRNCAYDVEYRLRRIAGRWYVSEAVPQSDCLSVCQRGLPTPTPSPTPTPTVTPHPVPTLSFPGEAVVPSSRPALPADLYFLREGRLWRWPAAGGDLELVRSSYASANDEVSEYRLSPDGDLLAYLTTGQRLYVLDRRSGAQRFPAGPAVSDAVHEYVFAADGNSLLYTTVSDEMHLVDLAAGIDTLVPTLGHPEQFALAGEGRYLVYLSVDDEPAGAGAGQEALVSRQTAEAVAHGALYAVDLESAAQPYDLGFCGPQEGADVRWGCLGFLLAPDGRQVVFTDDRGIWLAQVPTGSPRRLMAQWLTNGDGSSWLGGGHVPLDWFPDSERLLEYVGSQAGGELAVLSTADGMEQALPQSQCFHNCHIEWSWGPTGLWVSPIPGTLYMVRVSPEGYLFVETSRLDTETRRLWPTQLQPLSDGRVLFAHQRCAATSGGVDPWPSPGIFLLQADGAVRRLWPLPAIPCPESAYREDLAYPGTVLWTADGGAFLYRDRDGEAMLLGYTDGSALWDVRGWLQEAHAFHWAPQGEP